MARALYALAAAAALTLSACGAKEDIWQVTAVYTDPSVPGDLPADAHGSANFSLSGSTVHGTTPCALVTAQVTLEDEQVSIDSVDMRPRGGVDCTGGRLHTHEQLASLLEPGLLFDVNVHPNSRLSLVKVDPDVVDTPIITLRKL